MEVMDRKSLSPLATSPAAGSAVPKAPVAGAPLGADRLRVSLIIPARNEARNIAWVLEQIPDSVTEVILVDGASTDVTLITARSYRPDIKVVAQDGVGKGSALRTGFLAATGDVIVMMDADGSMAPQEISHFLHFLANGYDFVKGSRFIAGGGSLDITPLRRLGNRFLLLGCTGPAKNQLGGRIFVHIFNTNRIPAIGLQLNRPTQHTRKPGLPVNQ